MRFMEENQTRNLIYYLLKRMNIKNGQCTKILSLGLKSLERKKIIQIPLKLTNFTVELPPQSQKADISCNAAMILAKVNNSTPIKIGEILKRHLF